MAVDPAGHHIKPGGIDNIVTAIKICGNRGNAPVDNPDIAAVNVAGGNDCAVFDDAVKLHVIGSPIVRQRRIYRH